MAFQKWQLTKCGLAIEALWNADFVDLSPLDGLVESISHQLGMGNAWDHDGRYSSIVQSSGMGKSHLLDKFSKHFFYDPNQFV